jgi:signal peptidase II
VPILLIAIIVLILDQWTKFYIKATMLPGMSIPVFDNIFHITYVLNPGAAFGILEHQTAFFIIVAICMLIATVYFYRYLAVKHQMLKIGIALMAGGAVGNVIDRVKTGYVVDFFDFRIWPVFNIADIAIVTGVSFIIFYLLYFSQKEEVEHIE